MLLERDEEAGEDGLQRREDRSARIMPGLITPHDMGVPSSLPFRANTDTEAGPPRHHGRLDTEWTVEIAEDGELAVIGGDGVEIADDDGIEIEVEDAVAVVEEAGLEEGQLVPPPDDALGQGPHLDGVRKLVRLIAEPDKPAFRACRDVASHRGVEPAHVLRPISLALADATHGQHDCCLRACAFQKRSRLAL